MKDINLPEENIEATDKSVYPDYRENVIMNENDKAFLYAIENVSRYWYQKELPDHIDFPQFSRKLVVTNFIPVYLDPPEERLYVNVAQVLTRKSNNIVYREINLPTWEIFEYNKEVVENENGPIMYTVELINSEGKIVGTEERIAKASSIKYIKFLSTHRKAYLSDIFEKFMHQYITKFSNDIDNI